MKLVLSGILEMKQWGDGLRDSNESEYELFLGTAMPIVPLIAMNVKEAGPISRVSFEFRGSWLVETGPGECHITKYHHAEHQEMQKDIVFRVGDFDVYAYLLQYVGEWCQLTVELGGG